MSMPQFPVYRPRLTGRELELVSDCLRSGWISSKGPYINKFEQEFSRFVGVEHATAVCNGTVALHLALMALGVASGDEVIVPTLTYVASVNAIIMCGAKPVFVDSDETTLQMDVGAVKGAITSRTKAVMAVHLYGHPCDLDRLTDLCRGASVALVEDCAEAIGTRWRNRHVGTFGDVATFSFFGNKTITTGEGGMVVSRSEDLMKRARHLKGQGVSPTREYWHDVIGYNYRMTNVCAAIGCAQMEGIHAVLVRKREIADLYARELATMGMNFHSEYGPAHNSYWMCCAVLPSREVRDAVRRELALHGIETRPFFHPAHTLPMYTAMSRNGLFPVAERVSGRGVNLPSYPDLADDDVRFICARVKHAAAASRSVALTA